MKLQVIKQSTPCKTVSTETPMSNLTSLDWFRSLSDVNILHCAVQTVTSVSFHRWQADLFSSLSSENSNNIVIEEPMEARSNNVKDNKPKALAFTLVTKLVSDVSPWIIEAFEDNSLISSCYLSDRENQLNFWITTQENVFKICNEFKASISKNLTRFYGQTGNIFFLESVNSSRKFTIISFVKSSIIFTRDSQQSRILICRWIGFLRSLTMNNRDGCKFIRRLQMIPAQGYSRLMR
jgi:hypothetical protein